MGENRGGGGEVAGRRGTRNEATANGERGGKPGQNIAPRGGREEKKPEIPAPLKPRGTQNPKPRKREKGGGGRENSPHWGAESQRAPGWPSGGEEGDEGAPPAEGGAKGKGMGKKGKNPPKKGGEKAF